MLVIFGIVGNIGNIGIAGSIGNIGTIGNVGNIGNVDHLSSIEVVGSEECPPQVVSYGDIMLQVGHMTAKGEVVGHLDWTSRIGEAGKLRLKLKKLRTCHDNFFWEVIIMLYLIN